MFFRDAVVQWYTLCRYNFYISCRYSGGNDILLSGGQLILCRLWFRWWYSGLSSRCRTAVGLYTRCLLCGSPLWCFGTRFPTEIMLLLSIDVFSFFFFLKTTDYGRAKPVELLSFISQGCAIGLYMADPFRLMAHYSKPIVRCLKNLLSRCLIVLRH